MDIDNFIEIAFEIAGKFFSFVKGRKNYVPQFDLIPNSSVIFEVKSKKFILITTDSKNKPTISQIYHSDYDEFKDLKKMVKDKDITKKEYGDLKEDLIKKIKNNRKK